MIAPAAGCFSGARGMRGAATLMAVLFLLIVVAFAVLAAIRMSGSDVIDTSLGQSGLNALLLAESGVERAAARYVSGTACTALSVDGPHTLGQGSFTVNGAYSTDFSGAKLPADECRIQSVGAVGVVQRTVQAILQLPASAPGFVVGNGGVALHCGGSGGSASCKPTGTNTTDNLVGVSCPTASGCMAVGANGTVIEWTGSSWSTLLGQGSGLQFTSVSCAPGGLNDCYVTGSWFGSWPIILYWDGISWYYAYVNFGGPVYSSISCAGTGAGTTCYAVGSGSQYWVGNIASANLLNANSTYPLYAVSCVSVSACWATENYGRNYHGGIWYFDQLGSTGGTETASYRVGGNAADLYSISCDAVADCWVAGAQKGGHATFAYWNGTWTAQPSTAAKQNLYGIDCLTANDCWAAGGGGTVLQGTGTGSARIWSAVTSGTTAQLNAVSFPESGSGAGGSTVVIQWHEIES